MQITDQQKVQLIGKLTTEFYNCQLDPQLIDFEAEIDSTLTYQENYTIFMDKLETLLKTNQNYQLKQRAKEDKQSMEREKCLNLTTEQRKVEWFQKITQKSVVCGIIGKRGSGKSALAFHFLELHKQLKPERICYTYKFPKPSLLPEGIISLNTIEEAKKGSVIVIDEAAIEFNQFSFNKDNSKELSNFIKIARHNDVSLIFISQSSAMLTRDVRRLIDFYLLREPSNSQLYDETSIIKRLYQNCFMLFSTETAKKKGYFIADWELMEFCTFDLPVWWTEEISKAYSNKQETFNSSHLLFSLGRIEVSIK